MVILLLPEILYLKSAVFILTLYIPTFRVLVFNLATPLLSVLTVNTLDSLPEVNLILIFILLTTFLVFLFLTFTLKYLSVLTLYTRSFYSCWSLKKPVNVSKFMTAHIFHFWNLWKFMSTDSLAFKFNGVHQSA